MAAFCKALALLAIALAVAAPSALATCNPVCTGRTTTNTCPVSTSSWTPCIGCSTNSLVLSYSAQNNCYKCKANPGPNNFDSCYWCVTNALVLAKGKTSFCSCCDQVANCYNALENSLVNSKGWEKYVIRCKEKFSGNAAARDSCFWCLTNALTTDPKVCTQDTLPVC